MVKPAREEKNDPCFLLRQCLCLLFLSAAGAWSVNLPGLGACYEVKRQICMSLLNLLNTFLEARRVGLAKKKVD